MTLKKLIFWFWSTLLIGAVTALALAYLFEFIVGEVIFGIFTGRLLLGLSLAAIAELGFFSYLIFNWLSRGLIRNRNWYHIFLLGLVAVVLGNLVYLTFIKFKGEDFWIYLLIPVLITVVALVISQVKAKWTQPIAFIPTLFFMVAATTLEAIPSINIMGQETPFLILLQNILVLLVCNGWQILQLHKWVQKPNKKS
ncbi:KinB-signaling pathway activation protein [Hazenella coriacea]|uniref:KinB signaling pathway activation protein n=1 Tax=Hazenella coriacea TaxID=1179467 RepID=A0A4R3L562_9BACL|nr:KinB-signaling pathway activation protein [Hazenella coriacea]TCS94138.1 KinB signaling pathway activation protein [Hazenella coriacea]